MLDLIVSIFLDLWLGLVYYGHMMKKQTKQQRLQEQLNRFAEYVGKVKHLEGLYQHGTADHYNAVRGVRRIEAAILKEFA